MTDDKDPEEHTQPIEINPTEHEEKPEDEDAPVESLRAIPEWLIEFASQPVPQTESHEGELLTVAEPAAEETNENSVVLEAGEWHEVQGDLETTIPPVEETGPIAEFEQTLRELLDNSDFQAAAGFIQQKAVSSELIEKSKTMLRSRLILREEAQPLWNIYEALSEKTYLEDEWRDH